MDRQADTERDKNFVGGLAKGLRLLEAFDSAHTRMTSSEAARRTGTTPAAARRCLLTLCELGYACTDGKRFWMGHGSLRITYSYVSSTRLPRMMQPALDILCEKTRESAGLCVLDGTEAVIAARSSAKRTMRVDMTVGTRMPLYCSSAGRSLIAHMSRREWMELVQSQPLAALTPHTETTIAGLARSLRGCQCDGYVACEEEMELGVRSMSVPLFDRTGATIASISLSARIERLTMPEFIAKFLPMMRESQEWARTRF